MVDVGSALGLWVGTSGTMPLSFVYWTADISALTEIIYQLFGTQKYMALYIKLKKSTYWDNGNIN